MHIGVSGKNDVLNLVSHRQHDRYETLARPVIGRLVTEVGVVEVSVVAAASYKRFVIAFLDDAPAIKYDDAIGVLDCREAVSDQNGRAVLQHHV